jgi:hypothetical protein
LGVGAPASSATSAIGSVPPVEAPESFLAAAGAVGVDCGAVAATASVDDEQPITLGLCQNTNLRSAGLCSALEVQGRIGTYIM